MTKRMNSLAASRRQRTWVRQLAVVALVIYWFALFTATHLPGGTVSLRIGLDKVLHLTAYAGLGGLFMLVAQFRGRLNRTGYLRLWVILTAFAAVDELSQFAVPLRTPQLGDWIADALGVAIGFATCAVAVNWYRSWFAWPETRADNLPA